MADIATILSESQTIAQQRDQREREKRVDALIHPVPKNMSEYPRALPYRGVAQELLEALPVKQKLLFSNKVKVPQFAFKGEQYREYRNTLVLLDNLLIHLGTETNPTPTPGKFFNPNAPKPDKTNLVNQLTGDMNKAIEKVHKLARQIADQSGYTFDSTGDGAQVTDHIRVTEFYRSAPMNFDTEAAKQAGHAARAIYECDGCGWACLHENLVYMTALRGAVDQEVEKGDDELAFCALCLYDGLVKYNAEQEARSANKLPRHKDGSVILPVFMMDWEKVKKLSKADYDKHVKCWEGCRCD